jgi:hypothetical protein
MDSILGPVKNTLAPAAANAFATAPPNEPPAPYITAFLFWSIMMFVLIKDSIWKCQIT